MTNEFFDSHEQLSYKKEKKERRNGEKYLRIKHENMLSTLKF